MYRNKLLPITILIVFSFFKVNAALGQTTILNDISEDYLNKLISTAKANYPHVKGFQNRINIAKGNIKKADVSWFDVFTFSYVYQPHSSNFIVNQSGGSTQQAYSYFNGIQVGIFFNLGNYLQKTYQLKQAKEELKIADYDQEEYFLTLATEVKKRYYNYLQSLATLKLQTQTEQDAEDALKSIKHKFEKGEETYDNFNKAQVTVTDHIQSKIQAETNYLTAKAELEELLGDKLENIK